MAASRLAKSFTTSFLIFSLLLIVDTKNSVNGQVNLSNWINVDPDTVPQQHVQRALNYINDVSPNGHPYKHGSLINALTLMTTEGNKRYRFTFNLEPVCKKNGEICPRENCSLDGYFGLTDKQIPKFQKETVICHPLSIKKSDNEQTIIENIEKQLLNSQQHEVHMSTDHNDRPFVAVKATVENNCPGCPYELNRSLPGLSSFEAQVIQSMDKAGISDFKQKLINVLRVTRAVPPGSNIIQYQLLVEIGESTCLRTLQIDVSKCSLQANLPIKYCLVTFEEQFHAERRITRNNCTDSLLDNDNEVSVSIDPNKMFFEPVVVSSSNRDDDQSTKTEFDDQIAQEAQEIAVKNADQLPHTKIILDSFATAKEQSKLNEKMKEFDKFLDEMDRKINLESTTVSDRYTSSLPVKEDTIVKEQVQDEKIRDVEDTTSEILFESQSPVILTTIESSRSKRSLKKTTKNNSKYDLRKLAIKVVELMDQMDKVTKKRQLIDYEVTIQHGYEYNFTIEVAPTDCQINEISNACLDEVVLKPHKICKCIVHVVNEKNLKTPKLITHSCKNKEVSRFKRELFERPVLGGLKSVNESVVSKYLTAGLDKYSKNNLKSSQEHVIKFKNAYKQIVAGTLYKIEVIIGESNCTKGTRPIDNCLLKNDGKIEECKIEVLEQVWIKEEPTISMTCNEATSKRKKRGLRGQSDFLKLSKENDKMLERKKLFDKFIVKYRKNYNETDKTKRFEIFMNNLDLIDELNKNEQGTAEYGVTMFADLTKAEFKANYLGLRPELRSENNIPMPMAVIPDIELPSSYDWRDYNAVTPVKNQGSCGSCWSFSVTGNIEGQYAIKHGKLLSLSEQELVDCDKLDDGCNGGLPDNAYRAIEEIGGLETESDYPYEGENDKCHFDKNKTKVTVISGLNITSNETQMAQWLVQNGPMSIGINANAMQFYMGGVSHPFHFLCNANDLDHGVLIVGYGVKTYKIFKKTLPYWLIKNSWGPHWGEQGYYRVYRGDGSCGVNQMVTSAVIA